MEEFLSSTHIWFISLSMGGSVKFSFGLTQTQSCQKPFGELVGLY